MIVAVVVLPVIAGLAVGPESASAASLTLVQPLTGLGPQMGLGSAGRALAMSSGSSRGTGGGVGTRPKAAQPNRHGGGGLLAQAVAGAGFSLVAEHTGHVSKSVAASAGVPVTVHKPDGATVLAAYLGYATTGFSGTVLTSPVVLNGQSVPLTNQVPTGINSYNYFATVTSLVKPLIDGSPAGDVTVPMSEGNPGLTEGEILTVVYNDPAVTTDQSVSIIYGALDPAGDAFGVSLASPIDTASPETRLEMSLGISFGYQASGTQQYSIIGVNGQRLSTAAGGEDDGGPGNGTLITVGGEGDSTANPDDPFATPTGPRSDDELYDLRGFVNDGDQALTVATLNPSGDDNLFLAVLATNIPVSSVTEGVGSGSSMSGRTLGEMLGPDNAAEAIRNCSGGSDPVSCPTGNLCPRTTSCVAPRTT